MATKNWDHLSTDEKLDSLREQNQRLGQQALVQQDEIRALRREVDALKSAGFVTLKDADKIAAAVRDHQRRHGTP